MMRMLCIFVLTMYLGILHGRLVFEPDSDIGYIVADDAPSVDEPIMTKYLDTEEIKRNVKRAFWNTVLSDYATINNATDESTQHERGASVISGPTENDSNDIPDCLKDPERGVIMGIPDSRCDDGVTGLDMDWDGSPADYTCYLPKRRLIIRENLPPSQICDRVSPLYRPRHYCMDKPIRYNTSIPTFGPHRPLWAVFGEYKYLPPQRWLHNIEHGSIVMLYHPCAQPVLVARLQEVVKGCIYKHVIAASNEVPLDKPLVLVAWGCRLEMATVDKATVMAFIRARALQGPEGDLPKQGTYAVGLVEKSRPPPGSDKNDSHLCPLF